MTIDQLVTLAKHIHDVEGYNLGASSTREYRNAYWERVVGCAHHGHPIYNAAPDPQWHIKDAGEGRPVSDDVAVSMPSKDFWDCIPGSGGDGYFFHATYHGTLPVPPQRVYVPKKPAPGGVDVPPTKPPEPPKPALPPYPGDANFQKISTILETDYRAAGRDGLDGGCGAWIGRTSYDYLAGMPFEEAVVKHRAEWRAALGLPPI